VHLQCIFAYKTIKTFYKIFLHEVARSLISAVQNPSEFSSDELQWPQKQLTPRGPKQQPPGRLWRDFSKHKLDKTVAGGEGKWYPARKHKVCTEQKRSCFEKYHSFMNC
jgi:hypothetical protein